MHTHAYEKHDTLDTNVSTCGGYSACVSDIVKEPGKLRAGIEQGYLVAEDAGRVAIQASETGHLRRILSLIALKAYAYACRTLRYTGRQYIMER